MTNVAVSETRLGVREKLLAASTQVFGEHGYNGTSTRMISQAAGVNLQAISYYFGGKEGLYQATAENVAITLAAATAEQRNSLRSRMTELASAGTPMSLGEARTRLRSILEAVAMVFVDDDHQALTLFAIREQMAPTEAFLRIRELLLSPLFDAMGVLIRSLIGDRADEERVALWSVALLGSVMVFRVANAGAMTRLGWTSIGDPERAALRTLVADLVNRLDREDDDPGPHS